MKHECLTLDFLMECLTYSPYTGDFRWLVRPRKHFKSKRSHNSWNARNSWKLAKSLRPDGYRSIRLLNTGWLSHRLAYLYMTGGWPDQIDHINGDRSDNRWENLRAVDSFENTRNTALRSDNSSGHIGVYKHSSTDRWGAFISSRKGRIHLGLFKEKTDAIVARKKSEVEHGYHRNHGRTEILKALRQR